MIGSLNLSDLNVDNSNLSPNSSISDTSNINTNDVEEYNLELEQSNKKDLFKTIQFGFNSTLEGAFSVGENLRDLVELYGTDGMGKIMMKVGYIDEEIYNEMMEETKANVAINYVKESADVINENQGLTGNVYAEDSVREIGNGLGKTGEILALSLVGGYLAEVAGTSAGAAAATTASNASKVSRWAIAGFSGMGEELQIAFQNGATLEQGKKASYVKGIWDAFQWMVGDKINGLNPFNSGLKNAALHVGLDSLDSGAEGLVQPAIQKIYDERNYSEIFKENGGWSSVATQAIVGGAFSAGSEIFGNIKLKKPNNISSNTKQSISISSENNVDKLSKNKKNIISDMDDSDLELAFFGNNKDNLINKDKFIEKIKQTSTNNKNISLTPKQKEWVDFVNKTLKNNKELKINLYNTSQLSSSMLKSINDLNRIKFTVKGSFCEANGNYKAKYNNSNYLDRITYTGYEMVAITSKLEQLESMINKNLPIKQRAHQIYDILASEIPVMRDYKNYTDGHKVSSSLRGITSHNSVGKEGLVCAGYSMLYKELCDRCNINCYYIRGQATFDPLKGTYGRHAWNVIIDENNNVIPVDVTWKASEGNEWFGNSEKFASLHVADPDEIYSSYSTSVKINNNTTSDNNKIIQNVIDIINQKYGQGTGIKALEEYLKTKNINCITRNGNARSIIEQIDTSDLEKYMLNNSVNFRSNELKKIEYLLDQKFGYGEGRKRLIEYSNTGNADLITRTNNARRNIQLISNDDIIKYINGGF